MTSIFEIIGPVMVGPSSSHTAGMARIGTAAHQIFGTIPEKIHLTFSYGMKKTYEGHKSHAAVIGGVLGMGEASPRLKHAIKEAVSCGIEINIDFFDESVPPNTVLVEMEKGDVKKSVLGVSVGGGSIEILQIDGKNSDFSPRLSYGKTVSEEFCISRIDEAVSLCREKGISLTELSLEYESRRSGVSPDKIRAGFSEQLAVMKESVEKGICGNNQMLFNLTGGNDGRKMSDFASKSVSGGLIPIACAKALSVMEHNGSMGRIVAAPTAGSAGIVPGCLLTVCEHYGFSDEKAVDALLCAALFGVIMSHRGVSFSGSVGGCQGEVGVSSAICSAALASLFSDDSAACTQAFAMCMKNLLGLICDPIGGPIEVPCIKRNAVGVANAFISCDMALAGIHSFIPPDEVIDALIDVQKRMPKELRCTVCGGLACTKTATDFRNK